VADQEDVKYVKVKRVVSNGVPSASYVELEDGSRLANVISVNWWLAARAGDECPVTTIELDDVEIEVGSWQKALGKFTDKCE
jgi:hypothetical protein